MAAPTKQGASLAASPQNDTAATVRIARATPRLHADEEERPNFWLEALTGKVAGRTWTASDHVYTMVSTSFTTTHSTEMRQLQFNIDTIDRREAAARAAGRTVTA